jgi:hypothetical protein
MSKAEAEEAEAEERSATSDGVIKAGAETSGAEAGAGVDLDGSGSFFSGVPMNEE